MKENNKINVNKFKEKLNEISNNYIDFLEEIVTNIDDNCSISKIEEMLDKTNKNFKDLCLDITSHILDSMDENCLINKKS